VKRSASDIAACDLPFSLKVKPGGKLTDRIIFDKSPTSGFVPFFKLPP